MRVNELIAAIGSGMNVSDEQLSAVLKVETRVGRFEACRDLSMALVKAGQQRQSRALAKRAFNLWDGEQGFIDEYLNLLRINGDADGIRDVSKRAGMRMSERQRVMDALRYFNIHHYAYQSTGGGDRYEYDRDILRAVERLAGVAPDQGRPRHESIPKAGAPLRVAYLVFGAIHTVSVLIRLMEDFARYHDHDRIEFLLFSPDTNIPSRKSNAERLRAAGGQLIAVDSTDEETCLFETARVLREARPDILVSVAALADYRQYYLFAGCSASARISLCYGPPAQFVPPSADWVIAAALHPLLDCPCDGEVVPIEATLPERPDNTGALPEGVVIPDDAIVLMAAGRSEKFLSRNYWEALLGVLESHPTSCLVVFGLISPPAFLKEMLSGKVGERVIVLGWLVEYHGLLAKADIVIDTFPSGGGLTIMDSMAFGIPVLSFGNHTLEPFDQKSWSMADELLPSSELILPRGDFVEFSRRLAELIENPELRARLGAECKAHVLRTRGNPKRMVRRVEASYFRVHDRMLAQATEREAPRAQLNQKIHKAVESVRNYISNRRSQRWW